MAKYGPLVKEISELVNEKDWIMSTLANISAAIFDGVEYIDWAGFYIVRNGELQLGPFIGRTAASRIPFGKGVCGTAHDLKHTMIINDVQNFPGNLARDEQSKSEMAIPVIHNGQVVAVLDVDSPFKDRFSVEIQKASEAIVRIIESVWEDIL